MPESDTGLHADGQALGVWVLYSWDWNASVLSIHDDELAALRAMERLGYPAHVKFVPFGSDFNEAIA